MPERIQLLERDGIPAGAVDVGKRSKWNTPFRGTDHDLAVATYERWLTCTGTFVLDLDPPRISLRRIPHWAEPTAIRASLHELRGHDLACWCPPERPCHADVLLRLANEREVAAHG